MADKTVTVGPGKTYATIHAALVAEAADLTDAAYYSGGPGRLIVECYNQADTTEINDTGQSWTTSADYYVYVKAMEDHGGKYSTSSYRLEPTGSDDCIDFDADACPPHSVWEGMIFNGTGTSGSCITMAGGVGVGWMKFDKCIFLGDSGTTHGVNMAAGDIDLYMSNCIVYGLTGTGATGVRWNGSFTGYIYNCTIDDCDIGVNPFASTILKNTRITNCATSICNAENINSASDYNLTDEATVVPGNWGAGSIDGNDTPTIDYVDGDNATLTSRDYHLGATDSGIGAGADLSSDTDLSFTDDIDGDTRG